MSLALPARRGGSSGSRRSCGLLGATGLAACGRFRRRARLDSRSRRGYRLGLWLSDRRRPLLVPRRRARQPGSTGNSGSRPCFAMPSWVSRCWVGPAMLPADVPWLLGGPLGGRRRGGRSTGSAGSAAGRPQRNRRGTTEGGDDDAARTFDPLRARQRPPDRRSSARSRTRPPWWRDGVTLGGFHIAGSRAARRARRAPGLDSRPRRMALLVFLFCAVFAFRRVARATARARPRARRTSSRSSSTSSATSSRRTSRTTARSTFRSPGRSSSSSSLCNLCGLFFFLQPPTANLNATFALSITCFVFFNAAGIKAHGLLGYLKHFLGPMLGARDPHVPRSR